MQRPEVSVIMSVYNGEKYVRDAIDSILNQTFTDYEFIIFDDGSTDKTWDLLSSYNDPRICLRKNSKNLGLTVSLNRALCLAKGNLIARMDADDISMPERLNQQVMFLKSNPAVGIVGINSHVIDHEGHILAQFKRPLNHNEIMANLLLENQFVHGSLMFRKKLIEQYGTYDESKALAQDYDLILRLSTICDLANLSVPLYKWRKNDAAGISLTKRSAQITARDNIRKAFLDRSYNLGKTFQHLVLSNFSKRAADPVLYGLLKKLIADLSFPSNLLLALKTYKIILKKKPLVFAGYHFPDQLERLKQLKRKIFPRHPSSLIFLLKNTCNADCIMCGFRYGKNQNVSEISFKQYADILQNVNMRKVFQVTFSGGGEPLLCRDLTDMIRYTRNNYRHVEMQIFTNGISLTEKISQELISQRFQRIVISLNASKEEVYLKIMRKNTFTTVVSNIKNLVSIKNMKGAATLIQISFVASMMNIDDLPALIALGAELGADEVSMQYCRFYSSKLSVPSDSSSTSLDSNQSLFFHQEYSDKIIQKAASIAVKKNIIFMHEPLFSDPNFKKTKCTYPWTTILIGPEGEVFPCGGGELLFNQPIKDKAYYFGNLLNEPISAFWNNKDYRKLRQSCGLNSTEGQILQCSNCNHTLLLEGAGCKKAHFIHI